MKTFLSSFPKKRFSLTSALMCNLKFSLSSVVMPSMSTDGTASICSEQMINLTSVLFDLRLSNTTA